MKLSRLTITFALIAAVALTVAIGARPLVASEAIPLCYTCRLIVPIPEEGQIFQCHGEAGYGYSDDCATGDNGTPPWIYWCDPYVGDPEAGCLDPEEPDGVALTPAGTLALQVRGPNTEDGILGDGRRWFVNTCNASIVARAYDSEAVQRVRLRTANLTL